VSEKKQPTVFDEQTLAKVLEAAYVLQEHNRERENARGGAGKTESRLKSAAMAGQPVAASKTQPHNGQAKSASNQDFTLVLAQIVETQQQIQAENLDLERALSLIAERAMRVAQASGAGIGILDSGKVRYRAAAGAMILPVGSEVLMEKALCSACLRVGQVIRCGNVNLEFLVDAEECARRGIESLIAAPIHHAGSVAGALELYYGEAQSFTEPDVHACQLMAGLAGEVLARSEGQASKKSLQTERAAMRDALEKLKPNLEALVESPAPEPSSVRLSAPAAPSLARPDAEVSRCATCGSELPADEQFCGKCGIARDGQSETFSMQSKVALLWQMQEQKGQNAVRHPANGASGAQTSGTHASGRAFDAFPPRTFASPAVTSPEDLCETTMPELGELLAMPGSAAQPLGEFFRPDENASSPHQDWNLALRSDTQELPPGNPTPPPASESAIMPAIPRPNWTSAAAAREFLERVTRDNRNRAVIRFLKARRGDVYLVLAVILVACVIRWGIWSDQTAASPAAPVTATHHNPMADLSLFDRMLVKLGLADPPDPPAYKGNPKTQVWVDEQTALYYCPGTDLYGKTPKGRMTSQRDAQIDQYEPALRKPCD